MMILKTAFIFKNIKAVMSYLIFVVHNDLIDLTISRRRYRARTCDSERINHFFVRKTSIEA